MKDLRIIMIAGLLLPCGSLTAEPVKGLPAESAKLLQKLADWEKSEQASLTDRLNKKRISVAKLLETHLKTATKAGDLKAANLVQAAIVKLRPPEAKATSAPLGEKQAIANKDMGEGIMGHIWKLHNGNGTYAQIQFTEKGMEVYRVGREEMLPYAAKTRVEKGVVQYYNVPRKMWVPAVLSRKGKELTMEVGNATDYITAVFRK